MSAAVLVDTGVWIDHLHRAEPALQQLLGESRVATHAVIIGELACGSLKQRATFLASLQHLDSLPEVKSDECLYFLEENRLWGRGLGWADIHLLSACRLTGTTLWTRDKSFLAAAKCVDVAVWEISK